MEDWRSKPCNLFFGSKDKDGYGKMTFEGKTKRAHRVAWLTHYGWIPKGQHVLHHCDVRNCIEITHLFLGDNDLNIQDMKEKGRTHKSNNGNLGPKGEMHGMSLLTKEDVVKIKFELGLGIKHRIIAARYNVARQTITNISTGLRWEK